MAQHDSALMTRMGIVGLGLAHELGSPLASVSMGLELLIEQLDSATPPSPEMLSKHLKRQLARVRHMGALVQHLRALATGRGRQQGVFDLRDAVGSTFALARSALREMDGAALKSSQSEAPVSVFGDRILLEQAVSCVILNAADASGSDGEVVLSCLTQGDEGVIEVRDSGPGFDAPAAAIELGHSSKGDQGMGVGLALVHAIVKDAGGRLEVRNLADGAAVRICLPLEPGLNLAHAEANAKR